KVEAMQREKRSIVIAVSEGVKLPDGRFVCELSDDHRTTDAFGHINLTGTARYLSNLVARNFPTRTRAVELSILQRCGAHLASRTDITEAFQVGGAAAKAAFEGETAKMVALERLSDDPYQCTTKLVEIKDVANYEKKVPVDWINENRTDMLPAFLSYARPLIQAELTPIYINGLAQHIVKK
ncbi:MAG: 6-phosphofructokinase, partial [Oscillospiraceae bacterium]|nr:6-phosphofructokinase [Oscillospiraceae bacterium]